MEPAQESAESEVDDYELVPNVFEQVGRGFARLWARIRRRPTNWQFVVQSIGLGVIDQALSRWLMPHLPIRFTTLLAHRPSYLSTLYIAATKYPDTYLNLVVRAGIDLVLFTPVFEETVFRGLPIVLGREAVRRFSPAAGKSLAITLAVSSTLLFAWLHSRVLGTLPVPQLVFGMLAYFVAWNRGLRYSILLHMASNLTAYILMIRFLHVITSSLPR